MEVNRRCLEELDIVITSRSLLRLKQINPGWTLRSLCISEVLTHLWVPCQVWKRSSGESWMDLHKWDVVHIFPHATVWANPSMVLSNQLAFLSTILPVKELWIHGKAPLRLSQILPTWKVWRMLFSISKSLPSPRPLIVYLRPIYPAYKFIKKK